MGLQSAGNWPVDGGFHDRFNIHILYLLNIGLIDKTDPFCLPRFSQYPQSFHALVRQLTHKRLMRRRLGPRRSKMYGFRFEMREIAGLRLRDLRQRSSPAKRLQSFFLA